MQNCWLVFLLESEKWTYSILQEILVLIFVNPKLLWFGEKFVLLTLLFITFISIYITLFPFWFCFHYFVIHSLYLEIFVISPAFSANLLVFFAVNSFAVFLNYSLIKFIKKWFLRFMQGFSLSKQQFKALWPLLMNRFQLSQGNRATMKRQFI